MSNRVGAKTKGWIKNNVTGQMKSFQYNPTFLEYSRGATYVEIVAPGMSYPMTQYVRGNSRSFPVELFLYDNPNSGAIESYLNYFHSFLPPEENKAGFIKPPDLTFCYGDFIRKCVLTDLNVLIERLDEEGKPIQARVTLQLKQVSM